MPGRPGRRIDLAVRSAYRKSQCRGSVCRLAVMRLPVPWCPDTGVFTMNSLRRWTASSAFPLAALMLAALLAPRAAGAQSCPAPAEITRGVAPPLAAVRYLADDQLRGRLAGSQGEHCAAEYLAGEFKRLGLRPRARTAPTSRACRFHRPSIRTRPAARAAT